MPESPHFDHISKIIASNPEGVPGARKAIKRQYRHLAITAYITAIIHLVLYALDPNRGFSDDPTVQHPLLIAVIWGSLATALLVRPVRLSTLFLMWAAILEILLLWETVGWHRIMLLDVYILVQAFFASGSLFILSEIDQYPDDYKNLPLPEAEVTPETQTPSRPQDPPA